MKNITKFLIGLGMCSGLATLGGTQLVYAVSNGEENEARDSEKRGSDALAQDDEGSSNRYKEGNIGGLPWELWNRIFHVGKFSYKELQDVSTVCRTFRNVLVDESLWPNDHIDLFQRGSTKYSRNPLELHKEPVLTVTLSELLALAQYGDGVRGLRVKCDTCNHFDEPAVEAFVAVQSAFPHLEVLDLSGYCGVTDQAIPCFPEGLKELNLERGHVTDAIGEYLNKAQKLKVLNLNGTRVTDAVLKDLPRTLEVLWLRSFNITDAGLRDIPRGLKTLDLSVSQITNEGLSAYLEGADGLEELIIEMCGNITEAGLRNLPTTLRKLNVRNTGMGDGFSDKLATLSNLEVLDVSQTLTTRSILDHCPVGLKELSISGNFEDPAKLCEYLRQADKLERLKVNNFPYSQDAVVSCLPTSLVELDLINLNFGEEARNHLRQCENLKQLYLYGEGVTDEVVQCVPANVKHLTLNETRVTNAVGDYLKNLGHLERLDLINRDNSTDLTEEILGFIPSSVVYLDFRRVPVTQKGLSQLPASMKGLALMNCSVTELNSGCFPEGLESLDLTDCSKVEFSEGCLPTTLRTLRLVECRELILEKGCFPESLEELSIIDSQVSKELFTYLSTLDKLTTLTLREVGDVEKACYCFPKELRVLSLDENGSKDGLLSLVPEALEQLSLSGDNITDAGIEQLKRLKGLRLLVLHRCTNVTDGAVEVLKLALPGLEITR